MYLMLITTVTICFFIVIKSSKRQVDKKKWIADKRTVFLLILVGASILGNIASGFGFYWILSNAASKHHGNVHYFSLIFKKNYTMFSI